MPHTTSIEALILRRNYPVPVTFADLRRAHRQGAQSKNAVFESFGFRLQRAPRGRVATSRWWHAALKEATGAHDDVYAVIDGREVHIATVVSATAFHSDIRHMAATRIADLLEKADDAGYWANPREVRLDLQASIPSLKSIDATTQRSMKEAEVRRGH